MKYYATKHEAAFTSVDYIYLIGEKMSPPFSTYTIDSITIEKNPIGMGFLIILSHDVFNGGWPETTGFRCPQVELNDYLDYLKDVPLYL